MQLYLEGGAWFKEKHTWKNKFFGYQKERIIKCQWVSWPEDDVIFLRPFFLHLCEAPDFDKGQDCWPPYDSVFIPMCNKRYISKPQKKSDQFLERLIPHVVSFLLPVFLAEFPSGAWMLAMSTYLSRLSSPCKKEPKKGHLPIFKWRRWPNVDGANSLSWNFIGIPRKPSYSASFSLLLFSGRIPIWCMGTHQAC